MMKHVFPLAYNDRECLSDNLMQASVLQVPNAI